MEFNEQFGFIETSRKMFTDDETDSIWLYDVLDIIGVNEEYRKTAQRVYVCSEILQTFLYPRSTYFVGSRAEGVFTSGQFLCYYERRICSFFIYYSYSMHAPDITKNKITYHVLLKRTQIGKITKDSNIMEN